MRKKRLKHDPIVQRIKNRGNEGDEKLSLFENITGKVSVEKLNKSEEIGKTNTNGDDDDDTNEIHRFEDGGLDITVRNGDDDDDEENDGGAATSGKTSVNKKKRKFKEIVDKEHFIPYKPKNYETEKALGINSSFHREASHAQLDLTG